MLGVGIAVLTLKQLTDIAGSFARKELCRDNIIPRRSRFDAKVTGFK